ncbi:hypothetical protein QL285_062297 [Trifolium repens]|nr:hypothetical protein QL285_062297 [Trifolium repens]
MRQIQEVRSNAANSKSPILCGKFKRSDLIQQSFNHCLVPTPSTTYPRLDHTSMEIQSLMFSIFKSPIRVQSSLVFRGQVFAGDQKSDLMRQIPNSDLMRQIQSPIICGKPKVQS